MDTISYLVLAFSVNFAAIILIAIRYSLIAGVINEDIRVTKSLYIHLVSSLLGFLSPFKLLTLTAKPFIIKDFSSISLKKSSFITLLLQLTDFMMMIIAIILLLFLIGQDSIFDPYIAPLAGIIIVIVLLMILSIIFYKQALTFLSLLFNKLPPRIKVLWQSKLKKKDIAYYLQIAGARIFNKKTIISILPLLFLQLFLIPLMIFFLSRAYNFPISYSSSFVAYWFSFIIGMISGIPGGVGIRDVSMGGYLTAQGMPMKIVVFVVGAYRTITLIPTLAIGVPQIFRIVINKLKKYYRRYKNHPL